MTIPAENITDILRQDWQHISLKYGQLSCDHCGEVSNSTKRAMSLASHLHRIYGFVHIHLQCKPSEIL
jgi:hypothetical protein